MGGISTWSDAAEFLLLGASSLQVCTAVMHYGFRIIEDLCDGLVELDGRQGIRDDQRLSWQESARGFPTFKDLDLSFRAVARIDPAKCIKCDLCYVACNDAAHQCIDLIAMAAVSRLRRRQRKRSVRVRSPRARRRLRRLPVVLQRVSGGPLHRDGGSAFRPRAGDMGTTVVVATRK